MTAHADSGSFCHVKMDLVMSRYACRGVISSLSEWLPIVSFPARPPEVVRMTSTATCWRPWVPVPLTWTLRAFLIVATASLPSAPALGRALAELLGFAPRVLTELPGFAPPAAPQAATSRPAVAATAANGQE